MEHIHLKKWAFYSFLNKKGYIKIVLLIGFSLAFNQQSIAQAKLPHNVSYNLNTIPIRGTENTAFGDSALNNNTTGNANVANGYQALYSNTTGNGNVANGWSAIYYNTVGNANTANGERALYSNTSGSNNVANGYQTLYYNTTGYSNTANGKQALVSNTTGSKNSALGSGADVSIGTLNNATAIGANAVVNASNKIRLGDASVSVIEGNVAYSVFSDGRFKTDIVKDDSKKAYDFIMNITPVTYKLNKQAIVAMWTKNMSNETRQKYMENTNTLNTKDITTNGLIAQDVEKVAQKVGYSFDGVNKPTNDNGNYSIAYSQLVMPLISTVQQQQKQIDTLQQQIDELKKMVVALTNQSIPSKPNPTDFSTNNPVSSSSDAIKVYPNPSNGTFTITTNGMSGTMEVYDMTGNKIKVIALTNQTSNTVNLSGYAKGMYLLNIISKDGKKIAKQIVIQ